MPGRRRLAAGVHQPRAADDVVPELPPGRGQGEQGVDDDPEDDRAERRPGAQLQGGGDQRRRAEPGDAAGDVAGQRPRLAEPGALCGDDPDAPGLHRQRLAAHRPAADEIDAVDHEREGAHDAFALQRMALAGLGEEQGAQHRRHQGDAEQQRRLVDEAGHSPRQRRGRTRRPPAARRRRWSGVIEPASTRPAAWLAGRPGGAGAGSTAPARRPRPAGRGLGSRVERFTNSGVAVILGMPDC